MNREVRICAECKSEYYSDTSEMMKLCPDCSHYLYGYPNCDHVFKNGRCTKCYWNGESTKFIIELKNKVINKWTAISLSEIKELIESGVSKMTDDQLVIWNQIAIAPEKWEEDEYGKEGGGFWIVTVDGKEVIWYNDIEEGFNISTFSVRGRIDYYSAEQEELQWTINKLKRHHKNGNK